MNKAILRNSEIEIFDQKNNFTAAQVIFFSNLLDREQIFFFFTSALALLDKNKSKHAY